jgi:hypothetical protein
MKEFYSRQARLFLTVGVVLLSMGVIGALSFESPPVSVFGAAVLPLILGYWFKTHPIVRIFDDRIEIKGAPLAAKKIVSVGEIERVVASDPRTVVLFTSRGRVVVPTFALQDYERREIIERLGGAG